MSACWLFDGPRLAAGVHAEGLAFELAVPDGWTFEGSLSDKFTFIENGAGQQAPTPPFLEASSLQAVVPRTYPPVFEEAWATAAKHLDGWGQVGLRWLRTSFDPAAPEHLAFLLGNQLVLVFVEVPGLVACDGPARAAFLNAAAAANAIPALLPLVRTAGAYRPKHPGWGLVDVTTDALVDVGVGVSDKCIEMTEWELHDFATQAVANALTAAGTRVVSRQTVLDRDPTMWIEDTEGLAWVVVRAVRYPTAEAPRPPHLPELLRRLAAHGGRGFFASVGVAGTGEEANPDPNGLRPLNRGHAMYVRYEGLEAVVAGA